MFSGKNLSSYVGDGPVSFNDPPKGRACSSAAAEHAPRTSVLKAPIQEELTPQMKIQESDQNWCLNIWFPHLESPKEPDYLSL